MRDQASDASARDARGLRVAVVVSTYHADITTALKNGALAALEELGVPAGHAVVIEVPGAFEVPFAARRAAETARFDAIVCLGCVVRGETPHFEYIASAVAHGIMTASQAADVPMSFGVLTTNSLEEAMARAEDGPANKGREAAIAAVELVAAVRRVSGARGAGR